MKGTGAHRTYGVPVEWRGRPGVAAVCTCGWQGPNRYGSMATRRANDDADDHREARAQMWLPARSRREA